MSRFSFVDCVSNTPKISIDTDSSKNNVVIGHNSNNIFSDGFTGCTVVGNGAMCSGNNQVQLGSNLSNIYTTSGIQNMSDMRDKTEVRDTVLGLDFISRLRPVDYKWNCRQDYIVSSQTTKSADGFIVPVLEELPNDGSKTRSRFHHGVIAQEVKTVMDTLGIDFGGYQDHSIKGGKDQLTVAYTELIGPMIKAIQELNDRVKDLEGKLEIGK